MHLPLQWRVCSLFPAPSLAQLTKKITSSKVRAEKAEKTPTAKNTSDFGYNRILTDLYDFKLTKYNKEDNLIQFKDALDNLYSDMTTNGCPERCNDSEVINHAKALVPGRFCHLYMEKKEELLTNHGTPFKALTTFLNAQAVLI